MTIRTVAVFGASGRQGQAQLRELLRQGYTPRAVSRNPHILANTEFEGIEVVPADFADVGSVDRACRGADAIFCQPPSQGDQTRCLTVADAAARAGVRRLIYNTTQYAPAPGESCGEVGHDLSLYIEDKFAGKQYDFISFRPTIFMENLLTRFHKPAMIVDSEYRYCQHPDLRGDWICHRDLARCMVAALRRDDLVGARISIGGPETLTTCEVVEILSQVMGKTLRLNFIPPHDFAPYIYRIVNPAITLEAFTDFFSGYYDFVNSSPCRPFEIVRSLTIASPVIEQTTMRVWAAEQDWTTVPQAGLSVASSSG
jgi:uncharacterized protein YbjT (DUF2867 family)